MTYIVYTAYGSYSVLKEEFDVKNFIGANVFDPETNEMFIVAGENLVKLSKEKEPEIIPGGGSDNSENIEFETPAEPEEEVPPVIEEPEVEVPEEEVETPAEEETPSDEQITE